MIEGPLPGPGREDGPGSLVIKTDHSSKLTQILVKCIKFEHKVSDLAREHGKIYGFQPILRILFVQNRKKIQESNHIPVGLDISKSTCLLSSLNRPDPLPEGVENSSHNVFSKSRSYYSKYIIK
jgi:hypothetical protein